jgi:hypothetical protein
LKLTSAYLLLSLSFSLSPLSLSLSLFLQQIYFVRDSVCLFTDQHQYRRMGKFTYILHLRERKSVCLCVCVCVCVCVCERERERDRKRPKLWVGKSKLFVETKILCEEDIMLDF